MTSPASAPTWYDATARVPRRGQVVRVLTATGVDHVAQFLVHHTEAWPSGAAWSLGQSRAWLPFADVVAWSPDPEARPQQDRRHQDRRRASATAMAVTAAAVAAAGPDADEPPQRPAVLDELRTEIRRTRAVLTLIPAECMDWTPYPSLPSLRVLALRLVRIVARVGWILEFDEVELSFEPTADDLAAVTDLVAAYHANEREVEALMDGVGAGALRAPWCLQENGEPVARMTRGDALRQLGLTPIVYHRGETALLLTALGLHPPHPYPVWAFDDAPAN
ncbi:hypothetical protein [Rubrivirga sp.]|uniref:hypothetical protein n=1 Tax=Rubrivirga sp. TaxID=1885344 RepID=UPI003B518838